MNSWDIFDTLIARRCIYPFTDERDPQLDREEGELIPILENILRVQPEDVLVSDMYVPHSWLVKQIERLTGLKNKIYLSRDGKATGSVWSLVRPTVHIGDNYHLDVEGPIAHGIVGIHNVVSRLTHAEQNLVLNGLTHLAMLCREARLTTWHDHYRELQLCQVQANFPLLIVATEMLNRWANKNGVETLLICGRDGYLWSTLLPLTSPLLIRYVHSSRPARVHGSQFYLDYIRQNMIGRTAIVDLCGTGWSLSVLVERLGVLIFPYIVLKYSGQLEEDYQTVRKTTIKPECGIVYASEAVEAANYATHRMVVDFDQDGPIYWGKLPETEVFIGHRAFDSCLTAWPHYADQIMAELSKLTDEKLFSVLVQMCVAVEVYWPSLTFDRQAKIREEQQILDQLHKGNKYARED